MVFYKSEPADYCLRNIQHLLEISNNVGRTQLSEFLKIVKLFVLLRIKQNGINAKITGCTNIFV